MNHRSKANPFAQSPNYWKVLFQLPAAAVGTAEEAFGDIALAVSGFETDEANHIWTFDLLFGEQPDMEDMQRRLLVISSLHSVAMPELVMQRVEQEDWLAKVARSFPPMMIKRFYLHGSHIDTPPPAGSIPIQVDAGAAFGSGEHGTTRCCLEALDWLEKRRKFRRILDLGCGSGILAIAAAKLWKTEVLATDIDPVAVEVTRANAKDNREHTRITAAVSDGYDCALIKRTGSFELIVANILARPLISLAPNLAYHLAPGGVAVLSGLLTNQESLVLSAHLMQGLKLKKRFIHQDWCTLVLEN